MVSLDNLLGLIDRLIQLGKFRVEGRRRQFKEIVEPLFNELQPLVDDYFVLFRSSFDLVQKSPAHELQSAVEDIKANREKLLRARTQVVGLAKAIKEESKDQRLIDFAERIVNFFYMTLHEEKPRSMSASAYMVELCDLVVSEKLKKELLLKYIQRTLKKLQTTWMAVVQSYGVMRIHSLK